MFSKLRELGFESYSSDNPREIPLGLLYEIRRWILDEFKIFIKIDITSKLLYSWSIVYLETGKKEILDKTGYNSPEVAIKEGIKKIITWKLQ